VHLINELRCLVDLMKVRICRVSFTTTSGIRHSAEIQADSLYEAAVEGIKAISIVRRKRWRRTGCGKGSTFNVVCGSTHRRDNDKGQWSL